MRIVGGTFRGRTLVAPPGAATRPTTDRTRESIFNILAHGDWPNIAGARVIDLFAGSGALGFEAMSRGAQFCLFVDIAAAARAAIRDNQEALGLTGATRLHRRSAAALGTRPAGLGGPFTLAFLDPPYGEGLVGPALEALFAGQWMGAGATVVIEQHQRDPEPADIRLRIIDQREFGDTRVFFATVHPDGADQSING